MKNAWQDIKLGKKVRYYTLRLSDDLKEIVVASKEEDKSKSWSDFAASIVLNTPNNCLYAFFDLEYKNREGSIRTKLIFFTW